MYRLKDKGVKVIELSNWSTLLKKYWENTFVSELSDKEKKEIHLKDDKYSCGFLWHAFSWEKTKHLKGKKADKAFDDMQKKELYVFYQMTDTVYVLKNAEGLKAKDILNDSEFLDDRDIFIVDKEFKWTYVITHEEECGPYFKSITK